MTEVELFVAVLREQPDVRRGTRRQTVADGCGVGYRAFEDRPGFAVRADRIAGSGAVESLNVSVAAGVVLASFAGGAPRAPSAPSRRR